ncbi:amidase [Bacillus sp. FJAT-44742]|uniref:amidase n=1 Tax=Bacillus sp. FJAT-44742 TaxID=2014005 RepID=UPI003FA47D5B
MSKEPAQMAISELAPMIREGDISPVEITESLFTRIEAFEEQINAFIEHDKERILYASKEAEKEIQSGNYKGNLHGIPLALKDILYFKDETVTMGSNIHRDFKPDFDATVVSKLKESGALFSGKLNMHEYAWGATTTNPHFGPCKNPWNTEKIPGGSSGGSGAAVAADMTIASLGTDTGGSIRIPSSSCGIVGLKPTHGRVSKYGCFPLAWSLDHIGPMTKNVEDAAILLDHIAGYDPKDPTSVNVPTGVYYDSLTADIKGKVIGINEEYFFKDVDRPVEEQVRKAIKELESMGARVEEVKIPALRQSEYAEMITIITEASAIHHQNLISREEDFGEDVRFLLKLGELPSAIDYLQAQQIRRKLSSDFAEVFNKVDVLISPTLPFAPPNIGDNKVMINQMEGMFLDHVIRFTGPGNLTGLPALSIPCGFVEGMPVGMQIMGPAFKEESVLSFAYAYEQTNPLGGKKPNLEISSV